jgi:hypothetical protein
MQNIIVKCDKCGWENNVSEEQFPSLYMSLCPVCNKSIVVDEKDMTMFRLVQELERLDALTDETSGKELEYRLDTAPMRNGKSPLITKIKENE